MSAHLTETLPATGPGHTRAAQILRDGGLVAFPTETVYGLGADATNDTAVARIFQAKGRPAFNPLIVHCADLAAVRELVQWNHLAQLAADAFWPGPLTLVLPSRIDTMISRLVTAGLDTIAVRIPAGETARALLQETGRPIAAPSANTSGQISPTRASHVLGDMSGKIEAVLDGGPCPVGIESTILGLAGTPTLLRPGGVTRTELQEALGTRVSERHATDKISAPGQTRSHYAPRAKVRLNATDFFEHEARLGFGETECDLNLSETEDLVEAAANLFEYLHRLDATGAEVIAISPIPHIDLGIAINDRLSRASADR